MSTQHDGTERLRLAISMRRRGVAMKVIAYDLGVSMSTVSRMLKESGAFCRAIDVPAAPLFRARTAGAVLLTEAEADVVSLAARGFGNLEIARERSRSVRTVANQLGRAYRKLGIAGRAELMAYLGWWSDGCADRGD